VVLSELMVGYARRIVAVSGIAAALILGGGATALADHPLEPDLRTIQLGEGDLDVFKKTKSRTVLGITNEVGNAGAGPLEITPAAATPECDDPGNGYDEFTATQTVYQDSDAHNGYFERGVDTEFTFSQIGCLVFHDHPKHNHWHVLDFSKYSLRSEKTGELAESQKVGFCLLDLGEPFGFPIPAKPEKRYFGGNCGSGSSTPPAVMGISPGWSDVYSYSTPGQQIKISGLPRGRYCLTSEADPLNNIIESEDTNNGVELRLRLNPERLRVRALDGPCELG
jgi:hypothetical protein